MVAPLVAAAAHVCCGALMFSNPACDDGTCEACQQAQMDNELEAGCLQSRTTTAQQQSSQKSVRFDIREESNNDITTTTKPRPPIDLNYKRSSSVNLFKKPSLQSSLDEGETEDSPAKSSQAEPETAESTKISIRQPLTSDSQHTAVEVDYQAEYSFDSFGGYHHDDPVSGFIDGNFHNGKIKEVETPASCYVMSFNIDGSILAAGLCNERGVALYESHQDYSLIHTIERSDTVSALDWIEDPFSDKQISPLDRDFAIDWPDIPTMDYNNKKELFPSSRKNSKQSVRSRRLSAKSTPISSPRGRRKKQLLAVGGFDGIVTIYSVSLEGARNGIVPALYSVRVEKDVYDVAFMKRKPSLLNGFPLVTLAIGEGNEGNGTVSLLQIDDIQDGSTKNDKKLQVVGDHASAVLTLAFGFISDEITSLVCGTKSGLVKSYKCNFDTMNRCWNLVEPPLFDVERNGAVRSVTFNHDSSLLIIGGYDKRVAIVDTKLWNIVREVSVDGTVNTIEFDHYNRYLMIGTRSKKMSIFDSSTMQSVKEIHTSGWVTAISWAGDSTVALRSNDKTISLLRLDPIKYCKYDMKSSRGEECCLSWSYDGRFLARSHGKDLVIVDAKKEFSEVARLSERSSVCGCDFCHTEGFKDRIAVVGLDGYLTIYILRISVGSIHVEKDISTFIEKNLWTVSWSPDASFILVGGRGMKVHTICSTTFQPLYDALSFSSKVRFIDCLPPNVYSAIGDYANSFCFAVATGQNVATILDMNTVQPTMEVSRKRTVRCLRYHPSLPVLAIGDGGNNVIIVDLVGERKIASFTVGGRVNTLDFSPAGDFIAVGSDDCKLTIHEITAFKIVQEIELMGFPTHVAFSGINGQYLAISHDKGNTEVLRLGPLLCTELLSIGTSASPVTDLPIWAYKEAAFRSPEGSSFLQRCMDKGSQESLMSAAAILEISPESMLTFNRSTGEGCFETAGSSQKPNIMKLIMNTVVDGTLEAKSDLSSSIMTTAMPSDGLLTLMDLILHHPPEYATDILDKMTFIKVPFTAVRHCNKKDIKECGSASFTDPWVRDKAHKVKKKLKDIVDSEDNKDEVLLVPAVLPLPGLGTLEFLSAVTSNMGPNIFDNDAMGLVLRVMWNSGIKQYFFIDFALHILFFICWAFLVDRTASSTVNGNSERWVIALLVLALMCNSIFFAEQIIRFVRRRDQYFRSLWHFVDILTIVLVYVYITMALIAGNGSGNVTLAVITTLSLTLNFVSLLRGFDKTGWLVSVLTQNFLDVRGFCFVMIAILAGFTVAFRLLFANAQGHCALEMDGSGALQNQCDPLPFGSMSKSILSTFQLTILGSYESTILSESHDILLASVTFVIATVVVLVVALNALIAVLGDSFSRVQEHLTANRRRERAELIVEYMTMMRTKDRKRIESNTKYFHALLQSDGHGELLLVKENWQGGLNALKCELTEIGQTNNEQTQQSIDQLRTEMTEEIAMIRSEMTTVLNDIFLEVKEISQVNRRTRSGSGLPLNRNISNAVQNVQMIGRLPVQAVQMIGRAPLEGIRSLSQRNGNRNNSPNKSSTSIQNNKNGEQKK